MGGQSNFQCLASSEMLTPHPLTTRRVCTLPPTFGAGGRTNSLGGKGVGEDARHCSVLYIRVPRSGFPGFHMVEQKNVFLAVNGVSLERLEGEREGEKVYD